MANETMRFDVKHIDESGVDVRIPVSEQWLAAECADLGARPGPDGLTLSGRIEPTSGGYLARGDLRGSLITTCGRCLEPADVAIDVPMAVTFVDELEDEDGDEDLVVMEEGIIDLGPQIHDEILLAVPIGPVCREDCAGLCPVCGGNRNQTPCDCEAQQKRAQSKFSALTKVKL